VFIVLTSSLAPCQNANLGRTIYSDCAKSVFILYAQGPSGEFVGQGSGFWISGKRIVTNAHVANAGNIFVDVGSARLPAKVQSIDTSNDLAILTVAVEITAKPLVLAEALPAPGEAVIAIGNPQGLERSISEGVVSAIREVDHRSLLQVTTPISHGSSGGPIVNGKGQVVGVAVGFLESGQSLNFAIPAPTVLTLLRTGSPKIDLGIFDEIDSLRVQHERETYSADPESDWQKTNDKITSLLRRASETAGTDDSVLLRVAKLANDSWNTDIAISTVEKLVAVKPTSEAHILFAQALNQKYIFVQDDADKLRLISQAEKEARLGVSVGHPPSAQAFSVLANVLEDRGSYKEAQSTFGLALNEAKKSSATDLELSSIRGLIRCADALQQFDQAERLLAELKRDGRGNAWDWSTHADRLNEQGSYQRAGDSYRAAAELSGPYGNWCWAAVMYSLSEQDVSLLFTARKCIDGGTGAKGSETRLAVAHRQIADVLNKRGVYIEGLNHAKEATILSPEDSFGYDSMAVALLGLRRFDEAASQEQQALRLSDGKYGWMHFNLGSAYFSLENWNFALQSFEKAAELSPTEPASAYNVAICNQRIGHFGDAVRWYQEYLRRKPNAQDKTEVLERIRILKQ
jgi:tetratricopeptide (TPR) repeat protein